jgi:hypothetical protein
MSDGNILVTIVLVIAILAIFAPFLAGSANDRGYLKPRRRAKTFRQFPTMPVQGGEEAEE